MDKNIVMKLEGQHSLEVMSPPNSITIMMPNGADKVMRITKEGVWVNPTIPVDAAANAVIGVLDQHIKALVKRQPLSDEAIRAVYYSQLGKFGQLCDMDDIEFFARSIEAAHGITNEP